MKGIARNLKRLVTQAPQDPADIQAPQDPQIPADPQAPGAPEGPEDPEGPRNPEGLKDPEALCYNRALYSKKWGQELFLACEIGGLVVFFDHKIPQNPAWVPGKFWTVPKV